MLQKAKKLMFPLMVLIAPIVLIGWMFLASTVLATTVPNYLGYEGQLTNSADTLLTGTYDMTFRIYESSTGGTAVWTETQNDISVSNGYFSVNLGEITALDLTFDRPYWFSLEVASDGEMTPRTQINTVGYSYASEISFGTYATSTAPTSVTGTMYYDTNVDDLYVYNGVSWENLTDSVSSTLFSANQVWFGGTATTSIGIDGVLNLVNSSSVTTDAVGDMAFDSDAWGVGRGAIQVFDGTASTYLIGALLSDAPTNGQVPKWNTGGTITWEDDNTAVGEANPFNWLSHCGEIYMATTSPLWVRNNLAVSSTAYLSSVTSTMIEPWANNLYDLGSYGSAWNNIFVSGTSYLDYVSSTMITVDGTTTSTFNAGISASALNITSATVSSTFANGIVLTAGCFNAGGVCLTNSNETITISGDATGSGTTAITLTISNGVIDAYNLATTSAFGDQDFFVFDETSGNFTPTSSIAEIFIDDLIARDSELHSALTFTGGGEDYLTLTGQEITVGAIGPDNLDAVDFGDFTCNGTSCSLDTTFAVFAWTPTTNYGINVNATTSPIWIQNKLMVSSTAHLAYVSSTVIDLIGSSTLYLTGSTTDANTGVIYKGTESFIHNFSHPTGGSAIPTGQNTFVGLGSGNFTMGSGATSVVRGSYNTGVGYQTLKSLTTGYYNTANGVQSLYSNTTGYYNTANGVYALYLNTTGFSNIAMGYTALYGNTTGANNTGIGFQAGRYIANGTSVNSLTSTSVYIGANTRSSISGAYNENVFGYGAIGMGSSTVVLGNTSILQTYLRGDIFNSSTLYVGGGSGSTTSTFYNGLETTALNVTSATVSSTFANGIDIATGCFAKGGLCITAGDLGGANTALSNLESVAINTSLLSDTANTDDLGSYTYPWKNIYASSTIYASQGFFGTGASSHSIGDSEGELFLSGGFEVNGTTYFDNTVISAGTIVVNVNRSIDLGGSGNSSLVLDAAQTPDAVLFGLDADSNVLLITEISDEGTDFAHPLQTNPTIFIHSADATNINQYLSLAHDQTNGVIGVGVGGLTVSSTQLLPYANGSTNNATDIGSYGKAWKNIYASSTAFLSYVSSTAMDSITLNLTGSSTLTLTGSTTDANTGVIYKGTESFIHNFSHPTGSSAVPDGQNTFVGLQAGNFTMGSGATAVYHGSQNTGIGYQTLKSLTAGYNNTALGSNVLEVVAGGHNNTGVGVNTLLANTSGYYNTGIGSQVMYYGTGNYNTGVGSESLFYLSSGSNNTALGTYALYRISTGGSNTAVGYEAGRYFANGTGSNILSSTSVYIGANTKSSISVAYNENVFGYNATGMGSSSVVLGNTSILKTYLRGNMFNSSTLYVGGGTGASTSTFANGLQTTALNVTSATVSSTFANGIDIADGCFAMDGVCLSVGASGANVNLSNLESVAINTSLLSDANNTDDLGAYGKAWKNIYASSTTYLGGAAGVNQLVVGSSTPYLIVDASGNVGIGIASPTYKFDVVGNSRINGALVMGASAGSNLSAGDIVGVTKLVLGSTDANGQPRLYNVGSGLKIQGDATNGVQFLDSSANNLVMIENGGDVGIGTDNPSKKLDINGDFQIYPSGNKGGSGALVMTVIAGTNATVIQANSDLVYANHSIIINAESDSALNSNQLVISANGNVGVATTTPGEKLDVYGSIRANAGLGGEGLVITNVGTGNYGILADDGSSAIFSLTRQAGNTLSITSFEDIGFAKGTGGPSTDYKMFLDGTTGNVGIATTSPYAKLSVHGYNGDTNRALFVVA